MRYLTLLLITLAVFSCEDPVTLQSRFVGPELVVDAWLNTLSEDQTIRLTLSQDYYDNRLPDPVTDAQVVVCQTENQQPTNVCFVFDHRGDGNYVWSPAPGETLGEVGTEFGLGIQRGERQYAALTTVARPAIIDSLSFQFEEASLGLDEGFYAQIYARDQVGEGDAYWIRSTFNDTLLLRPAEFNLAFDATFSPGTGTDGVTFIFPLRVSVNRLNDSGSPQPVEPGDKIAVEIQSLTPQAYLYLRIVNEQINNGQSGLFDLPVANSPGNVIALDDDDSVLGYFNVSATTRIERVRE